MHVTAGGGREEEALQTEGKGGRGNRSSQWSNECVSIIMAGAEWGQRVCDHSLVSLDK